MILQITVQKYIPTNAYFYVDDNSRHGFLIDPGAEADKLLRTIEERNFIIDKILLTHGHFDHIGAANEIQHALGIPVCMQRNGRRYAIDPEWNLSKPMTNSLLTLNDVTYLTDYSDVKLNDTADFKLSMRPVPGHTSDGCIYYSAKDKVAFVGDSVFLHSYGRTDMPGGNEETLLKNIVKEILTLPDDTTLLTGHSEPTTVAAEKKMPWYSLYIKK